MTTAVSNTLPDERILNYDERACTLDNIQWICWAQSQASGQSIEWLRSQLLGQSKELEQRTAMGIQQCATFEN